MDTKLEEITRSVETGSLCVAWTADGLLRTFQSHAVKSAEELLGVQAQANISGEVLVAVAMLTDRGPRTFCFEPLDAAAVETLASSYIAHVDAFYVEAATKAGLAVSGPLHEVN